MEEGPESGIMEGLERMFVNSHLKHIFQAHFEIKVFSRLLSHNGININGGSILDAGCGAGFGLELIKERFKPKSLFGIDIDPLEVQLAKSRDVVKSIYTKDLADTRFKSSSFDAIFVFTVLHHMPHWKLGLKELNRILKPGGMLLLNEHNRHSVEAMEKTLGIHHPEGARFSWKELEEGLRKADFGIIDKSIYLGFFGFYICKALKSDQNDYSIIQEQ